MIKTIFGIMLALGICINSASAQTYPPYQCDRSKGTFPDGICKPYPTEPNIPIEIRGRLYMACMQGVRAYGESSCCDHLTTDMAHQLGVCPSRNGIIHWPSVPWREGLRYMGVPYVEDLIDTADSLRRSEPPRGFRRPESYKGHR
jgi:hypothetical protein